MEQPADSTLETPASQTPGDETPAAETSDETLLGSAGEETKPAEKPVEKPAEETPEQKTAREAAEADNKKLLETDDKDLTEEQKAKKAELVKDQEAKSKQVPEKYELKIEGIEVNQPLLDSLTPVFKKYGLTQEAVSEIASAYAPVIKQQFEEHQQTVLNDWKKEVNGWKNETIKELGADSAKELAFAARFIRVFSGNKETEEKVRKFLNDTGVGNHPLMNKLFIAAGKRISEDSLPLGDKTTQSKPADRYVHPTSQANLK